MPSTVAKPEISISQRTLATMRAAAGSSGFSSSLDNGSVMAIAGRKEITIAAEEAGERLDRVLAARIAELSRSRLKALILDGEVAIGARTIRDPGHRVNSGDAVSVEVPPPEDPTPQGENIPLAIMFEDDSLIVI